MTTVEPALRDLVRIEDPQFYLDDPFPVFARMRAEAPVWYYEPLDTFVLTKHQDIRFVNRTPAMFSNARARDGRPKRCSTAATAIEWCDAGTAGRIVRDPCASRIATRSRDES